MTCLAIGSVSDSLHETAVGLRLMAIIAIEFLSVNRRNVRSEMPLVIETKRVRVAHALSFQLKLRVPFPEIRESCGVTLLRTGQFEDDLLRWMGMSMKRVVRKRHSFLCRCRHDFGIVMTGHALRARDQTQIRQATMFLMAG